MDINKIRNIAIIAHVDHGKTTLVDQLFKQSGLFRDNQQVDERMMDSIDLERERGITIKSKNGAFSYKDYHINVIDTPGHADFGGEVERVLKMADGVLFLVDAQEGPMPQSYFVLKKAVSLNLPVVVVVNKIDKENARCDWVVDQVFDLLVGLNASDDILDFHVVYASARDGYAKTDLSDESTSIEPIYDAIINKLPAPADKSEQPLQMLVSALDYNSFLGRLAIGKITAGSLKVNQEVAVVDRDGSVLSKTRITKLYQFNGNQHQEVATASAGEIVVVSGSANIQVTNTITCPENPNPIDSPQIDPPTLAMMFMANNSPFSGRDGEFVTSTQLRDRLNRELLTDVALKIEDLGDEAGLKVSGRGELHLSILIEKLMREGYEFQVSRPTVILKEENGKRFEPYEELTIEVPESVMGSVIEQLGQRKGQCLDMQQENGECRLLYRIPTRGLLGYQSEFMLTTKGLGVMYYRFLEYGEYLGTIQSRQHGVMVSNSTGPTVAFSLFNLQERGRLLLGPGVDIYEGQIIGDYHRNEDLVVNPIKGKKLTNVRASGSDDAIVLTPPLKLSLEQYLSFIDDTEFVECTPKAIRLRKRILSESDRKSNRNR